MPEESQILENAFLCLPQSTPTFSLHEKIGVAYLTDIIAFRPLSLWMNIWTRPRNQLSKDIIKDCLSPDHSLNIPWLKYI